MIKKPEYLTDSTREWWAGIASTYELEEHHLRLLTLAAEAWDRGQQARETLEREGLFFTNKNGEIKSHPAVAIERDSRVHFARMIRELDLDGAPEPDVRPPRIQGRS